MGIEPVYAFLSSQALICDETARRGDEPESHTGGAGKSCAINQA